MKKLLIARYLLAGMCFILFDTNVGWSLNHSGTSFIEKDAKKCHSLDFSTFIFSDSISSKLDTLTVDITVFTDDDRYVFSYILNNGKLTLQAWRSTGLKGYGYEPTDIKLDNLGSSGVTVPPNVIFGNVILQRRAIKKIRRQRDATKAQRVLFIPEISTDKIVYRLYLQEMTNGDLKITKNLAPLDLEIRTNPSPPKTMEAMMISIRD